MRTQAELLEWCGGAEREFGDPAAVIGQIFVRYQPTAYPRTGDITAVYNHRLSRLSIDLFGAENGLDSVFPVALHVDGPEFTDDSLVAFGVSEIAPGLWSLTPSLNVPELLHVFVVLYAVPEPAPWESRIL